MTDFDFSTARPFTVTSVSSVTPHQRGVYGLYTDRVMIYIGRADDLRERLLAHVHGANTCVVQHRPALWVAVVAPDHVAVEKELIERYDPVCNKKVG